MIRNLLAAAVFFAPALALAAPWNVDSGHSSARFSVRHMMVSNVHGKLGPITGTVDFNEKDPARSKINIEIDVVGIDTGDEKRDVHLRSPEFFDTAKFPKMTFTSKKVKRAKSGEYEVLGTLTMHGVKKDVTLMVEGPNPVVKGPWGNWRSGASATTTINRKDFGVSWNSAMDNGGVVVSETVKVMIDIEIMTKTRPAS